MFMNGGEVSSRFGTAVALAIWFGITALLLVLMSKAPERVLFRALSWFICVYLLAWPLANFLSQPATMSAPEFARALGVDVPRRTDLVVIVLDGFASPGVISDFQASEPLPFIQELKGSGFAVEREAWAPSTRTENSVGSYLDLRLMTAPDLAVLRGEGSLLRSHVSLTHSISYVESGWYGTVCGESVDQCFRRNLIDDSVQAVIDLGILNQWSYDNWGYAYGNNALRAMGDTLFALGEIQANNAPDYLFAHLIMPHEPYIVDSKCDRTHSPTGFADGEPIAVQGETAAYVEQVKCVGSWLVELSRATKSESAMVIVGDHGTTFQGQMQEPVSSWSEAEVRERGTAFLSYRLPPGCALPNGNSTLEAVSMAVSCGTGLLPTLSADRLWLESYVGQGICVDTATYGRSRDCLGA
jgi:hypothetical protein